MKKELITVIIPIYKVENYLDKAITSVVNQTYNNLEIILVNDGSPDNCPQICDAWAKKDKRIVVVHKKNEGVSVARNTALDIAKGEYIFFLDADDYISENALELLYTTLIEKNVDMCMANYLKLNENYEIIEKPKHKIPNMEIISGIEKFRYLTTSMHFFVVWNKLIKTSLFKNLRFPLGITYGEDNILIDVIFQKCSSFLFIENILYYYLERNTSAVGSRSCIDILRDLDVNFKRLDIYKKREELRQFEVYEINKLIFRLFLCYKNFDCDVENRKIFKETVFKTKKYYKRLTKKSFTIKERIRYMFFFYNPHFFYTISKSLSAVKGTLRKILKK